MGAIFDVGPLARSYAIPTCVGNGARLLQDVHERLSRWKVDAALVREEQHLVSENDHQIDQSLAGFLERFE